MKRRATRTRMPALGQELQLYLSAAMARLACSSGVNLDNLNTGSFGLVFEYLKKLAPASILNATGQPAVLGHSLNVQALHSDKSVASYQVQCSFMMMVPTAVGDARMESSHCANGLSPILSPTPFSADGALRQAQSRKTIFEMARIYDSLSVRRGQEGFQTNVDTGWWVLARGHTNFTQITGEKNIPLFTFAFEYGCLNHTFDIAVPLAADESYIFDAQLILKADAVSIGRKLNGVKAVHCLEARIAGDLASLEAAKEIYKRLVQAPHRSLRAGKVQLLKPRIIAALTLKPRRLIVGVDTEFIEAIGDAALFKALVVKPTMRLQHNVKFALLVPVGVESEFVSNSHVDELYAGRAHSPGCRQENRMWCDNSLVA